MSLPTINFRTFTMDDIVECLTNNNISVGEEFEFAREHCAFQYIGYQTETNSHVFNVGFDDEDNDEQYHVRRVYIHIGRSGMLEAELGMPIFVGTKEQVFEYLENHNTI